MAMATFNGEKFLAEQLDSFLLQSYMPDELVVCDDCSIDNSINILYSFKEKAPFDVVVESNINNLGYTQSFSKVLSKCTGDIVFLSDQDDVWCPNKIDEIVEYFVSNPDVWILSHDGYITDESGIRSGQTKAAQIKRGYGKNVIPQTGALSAVRKIFLDVALPIPDNIIGHDLWIHKLASFFPNRKAQLKESLQDIRRHSSNTSEWIVNKHKKILVN
ncbi:glycosyltransferase [Solemya velum gill symbiont]|uniref:glycosyltransferase n=1 Tax=Solemya velum gill symbiont TaxID=2340 RepID=UPI0021182545|nr:glycosyltransferase [Solemya velum gill symbiont]